MSSSHLPRKGDKVNDKRRIPYANGFVQYIIYDDGPQLVVVRFDNGEETYDWEDFTNGSWTDHYGGAFQLAEPRYSSSEDEVTRLIQLLQL